MGLHVHNMDNKGVCKYFVCGEGDQFITDFCGIAIKITLLQEIGSPRSLPLRKKIGLNSVLFCHRFDRDWNMVARLIPYKGSAPLPELMDRKKRDIMERKGDKEDENKRQKQQKESSAAAL